MDLLRGQLQSAVEQLFEKRDSLKEIWNKIEAAVKYDFQLPNPVIDADTVDTLLFGDKSNELVHDIWAPLLDIVEPTFLLKPENTAWSKKFKKSAISIIQAWFTERVILHVKNVDDIDTKAKTKL